MRSLTRRNGWLHSLLGCALLACAGVASGGPPGSRPQIAIIIDDLGYRRVEDYQALRLPGLISYSILPHTPHATELAERAHKKGREVLLHLPMESLHPRHLGPGAITTEMGEGETEIALHSGLFSVPYARGVSNHMGSLLTQQPEAMDLLMQLISEYPRPLYFVDSRTTPGSVAVATARRRGIPSISRDIFLDDVVEDGAIRKQFVRLLERARRKGTALAIGHPHPETLAVLGALLPELDGVELVPVSVLVGRRAELAAATSASYAAARPFVTSALCCATAQSPPKATRIRYAPNPPSTQLRTGAGPIMVGANPSRPSSTEALTTNAAPVTASTVR